MNRIVRACRRALLPAALLAALAAVPALAHEGNPSYRSVVREITPPTDRLTATVLDHDDALSIVNTSGKDVTILDHQGRPYARLLADGTVEVNARSALAVGENAPPADGRRDGRWVEIDKTGRYQWHDDRIKYRAHPVPPQVTDTTKETKVFDWRVPIVVAGTPGAIAGTLTWVGEPGAGSSFPTAAVVSLAVLVLLAFAAVVLVRRRRAGGERAR